MNDIEKIGAFVQQLRKEQNMTQKELAMQLGITDKAVSKWERGLSCPDISLLIPLAKILGVTTSELLNGERAEEPLQEHVENVVEEALEYSGKSRKIRFEKLRKNIMTILSASFLLAAGICVICDFCITGNVSWSLIVIEALAFAWLLLRPFNREKEQIVKSVLIILSLGIIPYLAGLSWIIKMPLVLKLGGSISLVSIAAVWCVYAVFVKLWDRKLCAAGISFLIIIPMTWAINSITSYFVNGSGTSTSNNMVNFICSIILALVCFGLDYLRTHKEGREVYK